MTANIAMPLGEDKTDRFVVRAMICVRNIPQPIIDATSTLVKIEPVMEFNIC